MRRDHYTPCCYIQVPNCWGYASLTFAGNSIITPQFSSLGRHSCCTCVLQVMCITNGALQTRFEAVFNNYTLPASGWSKCLALQFKTSQQSLSTCTALLRWSCAQIYKLCFIRISLHHSHVITSGDSARASHQRTQNLFFASFIGHRGADLSISPMHILLTQLVLTRCAKSCHLSQAPFPVATLIAQCSLIDAHTDPMYRL